MQLVIDIGNTDVVLGFFKDETLATSFRIRALKEESSIYFEYRIRYFLLENDLPIQEIEQVVISSVVPILTPVFISITDDLFGFKPVVVSPATMPFLQVNIDEPAELGSDLYANAVAAHRLFASNCVVIDFGTALTFTAVRAEGSIEGVAIAPGLKTAVGALFSKTAQLPTVPLEKPVSAIGKNTIHAIQSGIMHGYEGLIKGMLTEIRAELGEPVKVIATGGLSSVMHALHPHFDLIDINLTIRGIHYIGEMSR